MYQFSIKEKIFSPLKHLLQEPEYETKKLEFQEHMSQLNNYPQTHPEYQAILFVLAMDEIYKKSREERL